MAQREQLEVNIQTTYDDKGLEKGLRSVEKLQEAVRKRSESTSASTKGLADSFKGLSSGLKQITAGSKSVSSGLGGMTGALGGATSALGLIGVGVGVATGLFLTFYGAIVKVSEGMSDLAWAMDDMSARMGGSFDDMSRLYGIAKVSRLDFDKMSTTVEVLDLKMSMLQTTEGRVGKAMERIGVAYKDANGKFRDTVDVFEDLVEVGAKMDRVSLSAFATDVFGRLGAANFIRQVRDLQEKMAILQRQAGDYKPNMDGWLKIAKIINEIRIGIDVLKAKLGDAFLPLAEQLYPAIRGLILFLNTSKEVKTAFEVLKAQLHIVGIALAWLIDIFIGLMKLPYNFTEAMKNMSGRALFYAFEAGRGIIMALGIAFNTAEAFAVALAQSIGSAFGDMAKGAVDGVVDGINGTIEAIEGLINGVIDAIDDFLGGINTITSAAADFIKKPELATNLGIDKRVSLDRVKNTVSGFGAKAGDAAKALGDAAGDTAADVIRNQGLSKLGNALKNISGMDNPFRDWIPEGGMLDDFKTDFGDGNLEYEHQEIGDAAGDTADKLKDLGDEVGKQTQAYKVLYGTMFGQGKGFFSMLGASTQPRFSSYSSAGITYGTTGGLTGITIQNMNVRDERDIQRVAEQLDKLQKKDSRKKGTAYGF